jgi:hypothetical protein
MRITDILTLLVDERERLNRAIEALQGSTNRKRRPARNSPNSAAVATSTTNHRRGMSAAARKAQSERMKAYWTKRRKSTGKK